MMSCFTLNLLLSAVAHDPTLYSMGLLNFGVFECEGCQLWTIRDLGKLMYVHVIEVVTLDTTEVAIIPRLSQ